MSIHEDMSINSEFWEKKKEEELKFIFLKQVLKEFDVPVST